MDGTLMFGTGIDNSGFTSGVNNLQAAANVALGNIAADMVNQVSSAAAQIPQQVIAVGSGYEASMSQVAATMGITSAAKEFELLSEAAKEAGNSTKFSTAEASSALNYLALAGYDAEKSIAALPTVLNVAAAGGMDLASASDMITDAMSALGLETSQMDTFADQLAVTAQKSNTSVAQLGDTNGDLVNLFRCIKYHREELQREIRYYLNSREMFLDIRQKLSCSGFTDIQQSAMFYVLVKTSFGADARSYGRFNKEIKTDCFADVEKRISSVEIEHKDFEALKAVRPSRRAFLLRPAVS